MSPYDGDWKLDTWPEEKTADILRDNILDSTILLKHCPLDYLRDATVVPTYDLGELDKLAVELQHIVLRELDVTSLLVFRGVSKRAVEVVNGMLEWQKITKLVPDAIRMAIGIETAHTFTLKELHNKLCQKQCDVCGNPAAYLDMSGLQRRCLDVGDICNDVSMLPFPASEVHNWYDVSDEVLSQVPSFRSIPGCYSSDGESWCYALHIREREKYYTPKMIDEHPNAVPMVNYPADDIYVTGDTALQCNAAKLSAVFAPWLSESSMTCAGGVLCDLCMKEYKAVHQDEDWYDEGLWPYMCMSLTLYRSIEDFETHLREVHNDEDT